MHTLPDLEANIPGSKYFKWKEALWLPSLPGYASPTERQRENIEKQAKALDKVRSWWGRPIIVHSWLRPSMYNKIIGGAKLSAHLEGLATDFHIEGVTCEVVKQVLMRNRRIYPGRGEIDTTNWIHLDLREGPWFHVLSA